MGSEPRPTDGTPSSPAIGDRNGENPFAENMAALHDPRFADLRRLLDRAGLEDHSIAQYAAAARGNRTSLRRELLASGLVSEETLYRTLADELALPFAASVPRERLLVRESTLAAILRSSGSPTMTLVDSGAASTDIYAAPVNLDLAAARHLLDRHPDLRARMRITTPGAMRRAAVAHSTPALVFQAVSGLFSARPELSARSTANAWQGAALGAFAAGLPAAFFFWPSDTMFALHLAASLFFLSCAALRAIAGFSAKPIAPADFPRIEPFQTKTYSVLVALYREAEVVPDLVASLGQLVWPRSRLEIKLVCEEDDLETVAAIRALPLRPWVELVTVPKAAPRTKPKALNYALQLCTGDFVAIYDAEDRPDPYQLLEASQEFARAPAQVGCLQAPLEIANGEYNGLTGLFAMEYRALFHGLLPWLARRRLVVPLGGTSNHFRRAAIEDVMAWDAYNVTEDADLGLKLHRLGYRVDLITRPTLEDAPTEFGIWVRQRTRWYKGWMQTWLVHMRSPAKLLNTIGIKSFIVSQILFAGMFMSSLLHLFISVYILFIAIKITAIVEYSSREIVLAAIDITSIGLGYSGFLYLAAKTMPAGDSRSFWRAAPLLPAYWIALSIAAWRAAFQLWRRPHVWEKTPHRRHGAAQNAATD